MTFGYVAPSEPEAVLEVLAEAGDDARPIAGGTALVLLIQNALVAPTLLVGLRGARSAWSGLVADEDGLLIGALTTHAEMSQSPLLRQWSAQLAHAFGEIATVRIRTVGTVGGSLCHADPNQDAPTLLSALGGSVELSSSSGIRWLPLDEFFVDYLETAIRPDEVLTRIRLPDSPRPELAYVRLLPRTADDYAVVSAAVVARAATPGDPPSLRLVLGGVGPRPVVVSGIGELAASGMGGDALVREVAALASGAVDPIADPRGSVAYKRSMAGVVSGRAVRAVLDRVAAAGDRPS